MNFAQLIMDRFFNGFNMVTGMLRSSWGDPQAWDASMRRFEAQDRRQPAQPGVIVFTGSSSITFWKSLERDMAPLPVLNRGFGGSKIGDAAQYASRTILPYHPRTVVLYAGTNDIAWPRPATAEQVFDGYLAFVQRLHAALPATIIYYISISPAPSRWRYWSIVCETNRLIQAHTGKDPRLHFIDLTGAILGSDGRPAPILFRSDRLHPNQKGYEKWTAIIKPVLQADLGNNP
jgi:lysophospholipase L1-like esterase